MSALSSLSATGWKKIKKEFKTNSLYCLADSYLLVIPGNQNSLAEGGQQQAIGLKASERRLGPTSGSVLAVADGRAAYTVQDGMVLVDLDLLNTLGTDNPTESHTHADFDGESNALLSVVQHYQPQSLHNLRYLRFLAFTATMMAFAGTFDDVKIPDRHDATERLYGTSTRLEASAEDAKDAIISINFGKMRCREVDEARQLQDEQRRRYLSEKEMQKRLCAEKEPARLPCAGSNAGRAPVITSTLSSDAQRFARVPYYAASDIDSDDSATPNAIVPFSAPEGSPTLAGGSSGLSQYFGDAQIGSRTLGHDYDRDEEHPHSEDSDDYGGPSSSRGVGNGASPYHYTDSDHVSNSDDAAEHQGSEQDSDGYDYNDGVQEEAAEQEDTGYSSDGGNDYYVDDDYGYDDEEDDYGDYDDYDDGGGYSDGYESY
ncbi:unnamed protein product [Sympodiomycopsis kandeliae]